MAEQRNDQKGAPIHGEGQHGDKTHSKFIEELHGRHGGSDESEGKPQGQNDADAFGRPLTGRHRLQEDRQQHDEAEKNSEANQADRLGG